MSRQRLSDCCTVRVMVMLMAMVSVMVMLTNQSNLLQVPLLDEPRKSRNNAARRFPSSGSHVATSPTWNPGTRASPASGSGPTATKHWRP